MDKDFLLIWKMKKGDESAMESFVRKYYQEILRYCRHHISDSTFAEDLTQETFERFFRTLSAYQHCGKALNYLYTIARNLCKDYYKKQIEITISDETESEENQMAMADSRLDIERALYRLPEELREIIVLHYFQGMKLREIAEICEIGLPLVKYRLNKAKEMLKKFLGKEQNN